jgi:hypothetical protein
LTSFSTRSAIVFSRAVSFMSRRKSAQSLIDIAATSAIDLPCTVTASTIGLSRVPSQVGQGTSRI